MRSIVPSARSWLHLVLRRMGEDRTLVGAAFLVALVAATVAAACVIYPDLAMRRGLLAVLRDADPGATTLLVAAEVVPAAAAEVDAEVAAAANAALGAGAGVLVRTARSESWELPGGAGQEHPPLTVFAWDDGLDARATLVAGSWAGPGSGDGIEAVVTRGAADGLGVGPGSTLEVTSRLDPARRLRVRISGIIDVVDPSDPAWGGDRLALDGTAQPGSFPLRGPLYVGRDALLGRATVTRVTLGWRNLPSFAGIGPDDVAGIGARVAGLQGGLEDRLGADSRISVTTGLPAVLAATGAGIVAGRGGTAIIAIQLLVLAAYALVLLASLVVDQRRAAAGLAAARGAPGSALVGLAAIEGVLVAIPAVVLGPVLAVALVGLLAGAGDGAGTLEPRLTSSAVGLALAAGVVVVVGMVLPTLTSLGPVAHLRGILAGRRAPGLAERTGIDAALLVLTGLALWQLRDNGSPIAGAGGAAGVDPLLAAAPAIGLLAGGLVALRIGPLVASWLERPAGGAAGSVGPLAARGMARRSFEAGRAALLLVVATGIVLFAAAYGRTWQQSQRDQVAAAIPAELVGTAATGAGVPAAWITRSELLRLPGVGEAVPAVRESFAVGNAIGHGILVAVPGGPAASLVEVRDDGAGTPFGERLRGLADARLHGLATLALPEGVTSLRIGVDAALAAVAGEDGSLSPLPGAWTGLGTFVVVRDGLGLLHRLPGATGRVAGGRQVLDVPLTAPDGPFRARLATPLEVVAVELAVTLPEGAAATGTLSLVQLDATVDRADGTSAQVTVDLEPARADWGAARGTFGVAPVPLAGHGNPLAVTLDEPVTGPVPVVIGLRSTGATTLADAPIPGLVDAAARDALGLGVGAVIPIQRGSTVLRVQVAGVVDVLPGVTPGLGAILVDLPALELVDYARDGTLPAPTEWWLGSATGHGDLSRAAVAAADLGLRDVRSRAATTRDRLDDPLSLGTRGALGLAAAAALAFAVIGFAAAAWRSVRSRRSEIAVARALGLGRGQTAAWLALELAFQLVVGIAGGILLGMALAWAVLPSVSLTPDGSAPVPGPVISVPWDLVAVIVLVGIGAFVAALLPLRRLGRDDALARDLREAAS